MHTNQHEFKREELLRVRFFRSSSLRSLRSLRLKSVFVVAPTPLLPQYAPQP